VPGDGYLAYDGLIVAPGVDVLLDQVEGLAAAPTLAVMVGAVPGARVGALASRRLSGAGLRRVLFLVVLSSAVRVWWDLLVPRGE
jgi:uncharacterized membrane protein YfcA